MANLSERMYALRKERGLKQEELVAIMGVSIRTYRRYETEEREASVSFLWKLADFYGVSVDYLIGRTDER